jgi:hypothetical protein
MSAALLGTFGGAHEHGNTWKSHEFVQTSGGKLVSCGTRIPVQHVASLSVSEADVAEGYPASAIVACMG